jgi:peptidyl-prolyl cis-trans isomerase SurA
MKNLIPLIIRPIFCALIVSATVSMTASAETLIDQIIAVVEDDVITENELIDRINVLRSQAGSSADLPSAEVLAAQVLERMIMERLQTSWGARRGIQVDDLSLDQAMRNLARRNNMDLNGFHQALIRKNIDYITFREQVRTEMIISQVHRRAVEENIKINDKEIDTLIESQKSQLDRNLEYRLSHILIQLPQDPTASDIQAARSSIESLHEKATRGESFTQLAIAYSQAQDALEGGDLGWRNREQLPNVFADELHAMDAGDISEVLRSSSGFHLFRIIDTRGHQKMMVKQVLTRHILIRSNAVRDEQEIVTDLNNLRNRIINGEDFSALAKVHSEDPGSSINGGELGWASPDVYDPAFRDKIGTLAVNQLSEPFKSKFGWHILELQGKREHDNSEQARRNQVRNFLRQRKLEEERELWQRQLRDESYIENRLLETSS